jgi:HSP20 family protein
MAWDPTRDLLTMQERLESLFGRPTTGWIPPVDLVEFEDRYVLTLELPGLGHDDVQLEYADQVLAVRGTRPSQPRCPERYQQLERGQGTFSRTFALVRPTDGAAIHADLADGILTVTIPKLAADRRHIEVD